MHEFPLVDARNARPESIRTIAEPEGYRYGSGSGDVRTFPGLAQPLEQHISAKRKPHDADARLRKPPAQHVNDISQITGLSGMVTTCQAVGFSAAAAKVQYRGTPATGERDFKKRAGIVGAGRALETVQDQYDRTGCIGVPIEIKKITVRQFEALAPQWSARTAAHDVWPECLQVWPATPPGR